MNFRFASPDPSAVDPASGHSSSDAKSLPELIQMFCQANRSGLLQFSSGEVTGNAYLQHGQVIHAQTGIVVGKEAVYQMFQWPAGVHQFTEGLAADKRTIDLTWEQLLFEGALYADGALSPDASASGNTSLQSAPVIMTRIQGGQPKITVIEGELPSQSFDIDKEFVHVGRIEGNDIVLPVASVSSRHCMFIQKGSDIVVRDLNSSNGTLVNGKIITEQILQVGDIIQIGFIKVKLESAMKRPKLRSTAATLTSSGNLVTPEATSFNQLARPIETAPGAPTEATKTKSYVTGGSAIVYTDLRKEVPKEPSKLHLKITVIVALALLVCGVLYYAYLTYMK